MQRNYLRALAAVLAGAAIYWALMPHLPARLQHHLFHEDAGLAIYALISVLLYVLFMNLGRK
jgi:hypothetical protein